MEGLSKFDLSAFQAMEQPMNKRIKIKEIKTTCCIGDTVFV